MTLWLLTSGESRLSSFAMIANTLQQTHGLPTWLQVWISCWHALLQSCLYNSSWPWGWASNQSILECSEQYSPLWRSLPLKIKAAHRFWLPESGTPLASFLHSLWDLRDYFIVAPIGWRPDTCSNLSFRPWYDFVFQSSNHFRFQFTTF